MRNNFFPFFLFVFFILIAGCTSSNVEDVYDDLYEENTVHQKTATTLKTPSPTPTKSAAEKNLRIAENIVREYHETHTYYGKDIFVCADMASDVWNQLKTEGINAEIGIGRVDRDVYKLSESNHAWVLAEIEPNKWLALETTGGYVVYAYDNLRYYGGWSLYNPQKLKQYTLLISQYNDDLEKYQYEVEIYNRMVEQYNNADYLSRLNMKDDLDAEKLLLDQRADDFTYTAEKLAFLVEGSDISNKNPYGAVMKTKTPTYTIQYTTKTTTPTPTSDQRGVKVSLSPLYPNIIVFYMGGEMENYLNYLEIQITPLGSNKRIEYIYSPEKSMTYTIENALPNCIGRVVVIAHYSQGSYQTQEIANVCYNTN